MIGLVGSHRTGKTTLAKAYGERYDMSVCLTSASTVFKELGYDVQADYDFDTRMTIQEAILKSFDKQYTDMGYKPFIADRTPIDMLAYTLADIKREKLSEEQEMRLERYVKDCYSLCNKHFNILILIQPGIPLVEDPTKAPIGYGYVEHISQLAKGVLADDRVSAMHSYIHKGIIDLEERILCVKMATEAFLGRMQENVDYSADSLGNIYLH